MAVDVHTERFRAQLEAERGAWGETAETVFDSGVPYGDGENVPIRLRKRDRRYVLDDIGTAARKAGTSLRRRELFEAADRFVAGRGVNVSREGVVFVPAVEGRDLARLAILVAEVSRALYAELLELDETR